ncbi:hypothetical protein GRI44_10360 [Altererythrobacter confluentis]|uniref:Oligosaccharide repeat unit polymerase n=1 Tax=Allopontixanthobacter confluentis TaxID=1849021 RepID=A0A6L7GHV9_9SPHN|nr:oligosaccharide repeat unit polymerase [Allopontixanthobacter confluentis]MXP15150.1 hypothetical protein [Allopontixanthobacter confluentis]
MLLIVALFLIIGGIIAVTSNPDIFSPAKFYFAFFILFHVGIIVQPPENLVYGLIFVTLAIGLLIAIVEAVKVQYDLPAAKLIAPPTGAVDRVASIGAALFFCIISLPAVFAQFYMIYEFGGFSGYIASLNTRVVDWSGFGWARTLISMMVVINVAFFAVGLIAKRPLIFWALFAGHFAFVLFFGSLSGSRSGLLNIFALLLVIFHYLRKPIGAGFASLMVTAMIGGASLLGIARNGLTFSNGELTTGLSTAGNNFSFNSFFYGVDPLNLIVATQPMPLAHGSTFLSLFTNAIPRSIYPEKPDTGGVFFTKSYAGDAWEGFSNLTPTFQGEWIINFGWAPGIIGYLISYFAIFLAILGAYRTLLRTRGRQRDAVFAIDVAIYVTVLWSAIGLMIGEITATILGLLLNQLFPLFAMRAYFSYRKNVAARVGGKRARSGQHGTAPRGRLAEPQRFMADPRTADVK